MTDEQERLDGVISQAVDYSIYTDCEGPGRRSLIRAFAIHLQNYWAVKCKTEGLIDLNAAPHPAFYINLQRAVIGPSATLTGR